MALKVYFSQYASGDLEKIYNYILEHDSPDKAQYVIEKIENTILSLGDSPNRGSYPKELLALGIRKYRQIFFKPYRILYRVEEKGVYISLIVDGRRDMRTLLERRFLQG